MEKIKENETIDFERKNILLWIGSMNDKKTVWIGRQTATKKEDLSEEKTDDEEDNNPLVEYRMDFENRDEAVKHVIQKLREISTENLNADNLKEEDIQIIQNLLEKGENKIETSKILKD